MEWFSHYLGAVKQLQLANPLYQYWLLLARLIELTSPRYSGLVCVLFVCKHCELYFMNKPNLRHQMKLYWLILILKVVHIPIVLEGLSPANGTNGAQLEAEAKEKQQNMTNIKHSQQPHQVGEQPITRSSFVDAKNSLNFVDIHSFYTFLIKHTHAHILWSVKQDVLLRKEHQSDRCLRVIPIEIINESNNESPKIKSSSHLGTEKKPIASANGPSRLEVIFSEGIAKKVWLWIRDYALLLHLMDYFLISLMTPEWKC